MKLKTTVTAEPGKQELFINRQFDLPVENIFRAYTEPHLVEQWMGTRVIKLESTNQGGYIFETTDPSGNIHRFSGSNHKVVPSVTIIRTFEMENTPFPVQLEFLEFESLTPKSSRLTIQILFKTAEDRDRLLKLPFSNGISMAHDRLQNLFTSNG